MVNGHRAMGAGRSHGQTWCDPLVAWGGWKFEGEGAVGLPVSTSNLTQLVVLWLCLQPVCSAGGISAEGGMRAGGGVQLCEECPNAQNCSFYARMLEHRPAWAVRSTGERLCGPV